jgi:hypothetical protein
MFLASKTEVIDDNIKEQIVMHSRGRLYSYEEISSENKDNNLRIKIRAKIEKDILQESDEIINEKTISISTAGLGDSARQAKASVELFQLFLDNNDFRTIYEIGEIKNSVKDGKIVIEYTVNINNDRYKEIINSLMEVLDQISISKAELTYNNENINNNKILLQEKHCNCVPYSYPKDENNTFGLPINFGKYVEYQLSEETSKNIRELMEKKYGEDFFIFIH